MLSKFKYYLRQKRAKGKFVKLINFIALWNYKIKNFKQYLNRKNAYHVISNINYSDKQMDWVQFIFNASDGFFKPIQNQWEISQLLNIIQKQHPKLILEIGTANGGTLFLLTRHSHERAKIISVDLPYGPNGGGFPKWKIPIFKKFANSKQSINFVRGDSHSSSTLSAVKDISKGKKFDVIMIDADHSYEGAKKDFFLYKPLIAKGGIIVLHDILENIYDPEINVHLLWNELKKEYKTEEIINDKNQGCLGLGIVYL